jgi:two-component system, cell cycle response regulator
MIESHVNQEPVHILLLEDNTEYAQMLQTTLASAPSVHYHITHCIELGQALRQLTDKHFHLLLLDLFVPDSQGYDTFTRCQEQSPDTPVVVLTALEDEELALMAVRHGAQDYLVKGQVSHKMLLRALRYAIERQSGQTSLQRLTLIDDLTGLYNRRGFMSYGKKYLKLSQRAQKAVLVLFADLDGLKEINDSLGHHSGDIALIDAGDILRHTFRDSDIIGRLGGDEFAILAMDIASVEDLGGIILNRLYHNLESFNKKNERPYPISISVGVSLSDPGSPQSLEDLLEEADTRMYVQKRQKKEIARH